MNKEELKSAIEVAEKEIDKTKQLLAGYKEKLTDLKIALFVLETGLEIGTKIVYNNKEGEISSLINEWRVYPLARFKKKDGTLGAREEKIYFQEHIKIIKP